jgi:hypothetical protein
MELRHRNCVKAGFIRFSLGSETDELWSRAALAETQLCESLIFQDLKVENEELKMLLPRIIDYFEFAGEQANVISATSLEASRLLHSGLFSQAVEAWSRLLVEAINLGDSYYIGQGTCSTYANLIAFRG